MRRTTPAGQVSRRTPAEDVAVEAEPRPRSTDRHQSTIRNNVSSESESMSGANVLEINDLNFESEVLKSSLPFLLDFGAVWCGPCRVLAPVVDKLRARYHRQ